MIPVVTIIDSLGLGGAERLLVTLARHAREAGLRLTVVALRESDSPIVREGIEAAGVEVFVVPTSMHHQLLDPARLVRLARTVRSSGARVVHTHLGAANALGLIAARAVGLPVVATLHNVRLPEARLRDRVERAAVQRADEVVAVGHEVARTHQPGLRQRVHVLPNPVDLTGPPDGDSARELRTAILAGGPGPLIVNVGRLEPQKGQLELLEAFAALRGSHPHAVLALAGDGSLAGALDDRARALGLDGALRRLGARDDVVDLLGAADLFVSSSVYEGLPLAVLEAMAAGLAVVATAVGDVPEVLGGAGRLVPPEDSVALGRSMAELLSDDAVRAGLGREARARVAARHDASRWARSLHALYEGLLSRPAATPATSSAGT